MLLYRESTLHSYFVLYHIRGAPFDRSSLTSKVSNVEDHVLLCLLKPIKIVKLDTLVSLFRIENSNRMLQMNTLSVFCLISIFLKYEKCLL